MTKPCVLCGSDIEVIWVLGLDANLCRRCRSIIYEQEKAATEGVK
jgi:hypothetical protein